MGIWRWIVSQNGQAIATWVQGVGTIGAIIGAFLAGGIQGRAALRTRRLSILAIGEAARNHAMAIDAVLAQGKDRLQMSLDLRQIYDLTVIEGMQRALRAAPAHEVGSPEGVAALLSLADQMGFLGMHTETLLAGPYAGPDWEAQTAGLDPAQRKEVHDSWCSVWIKNVRARIKRIDSDYLLLRRAIEGSLR